MRVTDKMNYNQVTQNLSKNRTEMNDLQNQAATQKKINKPSDEPTSAARVLAARTEERGGKQFIKNITSARSFLEYTDQSLSELSESLMRAKELAISQASDAGASSETRRTVAMEIEQIYDQAVQVGNRKLGDRYIFGGYQTTKSPFDIAGNYHGDDGDLKIQINKDAFVAMNISGGKVFLGEGLSEDGLIRPSAHVPRDVEELKQLKVEDQNRAQQSLESAEQPVQLRGPASTTHNNQVMTTVPDADSRGVNVLKILKDFSIALHTSDKHEVQASIDDLDAAISQVINARAQVGSRISALNAANESLQKSIVDQKTTASQLEDADLFEVVSDINKSDSTLKATLETSGKVMNMSLLDFLK